MLKINHLICVSLVISTTALSGCMSDNTEYYGNGATIRKSNPDNGMKRNYSFPAQRASTGKKEFIFDPRHLMWAAYNADGALINQGAASGGRDYCPDIKSPCRTPTGTYSVDLKKGEDCVSRLFPIGKGGSPMPYCMFYEGGYAVHGSYEVPNYNASHGCIRVPPADAEWLSENFVDIGTLVTVLPY